MPLMEWLPAYELGITEFDEHHKYLVSLFNNIYDSIITGADREELGNVLDELIDYATYHFAAEEYWMKVHEYPGLSHHSGEHEKFCHRVVEIQKDFHAGKSKLNLEVMQFLFNWLTEHILKTDVEYARFASKMA